MFGLSLWMALAASPAVTVAVRPRPWLDPEIAADAPRREGFEFDPMFDHQKVRPAYALRAFSVHPSLAGHPERLAPNLLLGDLLFHAPALMGNAAKFFGMSCNSCHPNGSATPDIWVGFQSKRTGTIDMLSDYFTPLADDGIDDARRVPSLRGARYTAPYGHAGSVGSLGDFIDHVVSMELAQPPMRRDWRDALVLYIEQFDFLPDPYLDSLGHLNDTASPAAKLGEKLFEKPRPQFDGHSCASCHVQESFFTDRRTHAFNHGCDAAPGEGFDTPSLLNLDERAPYFFDACAPTLKAAVNQLDRKHHLALTADEQAELTAYLEAVGAVSSEPSVPTTSGQVGHALAYLTLLQSGPLADDRDLWPLCLETVDHLLRGALREGSSAEQKTLGPAVMAFRTFAQTKGSREPGAANRAELARLAARVSAALTASNPPVPVVHHGPAR